MCIVQGIDIIALIITHIGAHHHRHRREHQKLHVAIAMEMS